MPPRIPSWPEQVDRDINPRALRASNLGHAGISLVPAVQHRAEEHPDYSCMSELSKAAIRRKNLSTQDAETSGRNLLREKIVLGEECALVESSQAQKGFSIEKHKHARGKRFRKDPILCMALLPM